MNIYIGADHRGFELKEYIKILLKNMGYEVSDMGNFRYDENDDYPEFASLVAKKVSIDYENSRGVLVCGSGVGMDVVANKYPMIRASLVTSPNQAFDSRNDDDANILCLASNYSDSEIVKKIILTWLKTPFSREERHRRRINEINQIESELHKTES